MTLSIKLRRIPPSIPTTCTSRYTRYEEQPPRLGEGGNHPTLSFSPFPHTHPLEEEEKRVMVDWTTLPEGIPQAREGWIEIMIFHVHTGDGWRGENSWTGTRYLGTRNETNIVEWSFTKNFFCVARTNFSLPCNLCTDWKRAKKKSRSLDDFFVRKKRNLMALFSCFSLLVYPASFDHGPWETSCHG